MSRLSVTNILTSTPQPSVYEATYETSDVISKLDIFHHPVVGIHPFHFLKNYFLFRSISATRKTLEMLRHCFIQFFHDSVLYYIMITNYFKKN